MNRNKFLCHVHFFKPGLAEIFQGLMRILSIMVILFLYTVPKIYNKLNRKVFLIYNEIVITSRD